MNEEVQEDFIELLNMENSKLKVAGYELVEAAIRVIKDYDGIHRLSLAVSNWFQVIANQSGRNEK
jgi:hypothetical protein